jgi:D-galactarolactone cycloisomerase
VQLLQVHHLCRLVLPVSPASPTRNEPVVEFDRTRNPLRDELLHENFVLDQGALLVPLGPELGVKINDEVLTKYGAER